MPKRKKEIQTAYVAARKVRRGVRSANRGIQNVSYISGQDILKKLRRARKGGPSVSYMD